MVLLRRILPFVGSLFLAALYCGLLLDPTDWRIWVGGIAAVTLLSVGYLLRWKLFAVEFWAALLPLVLVISGGTGMFFFLDTPMYQWLFAGFLVALYGIYVENLFSFHYQPQKYAKLSLPTLSFYLNLFGTFTLFAAAYALELINVIPPWANVLLAIGLGLSVTVHLLRGHKLWGNNQWGIAFFVALLLGELTWAMQYWPTAYYVNGIVVAVVLYALVSLVLLKLRDTLSKKAVVQYVAVSALALLAVLGTSQWQ
jgi:hypothetical protein